MERERRECSGSSSSSSSRHVSTLAAMVMMEVTNVGLTTLYKAATLRGMSYNVFLVYGSSLAALISLPSPFLSYRSRALPPLNFSILSKIGLLGLIGSTSQIMGYRGINYSSPTLASAMSSLTPAFTFIFAILFRMEKLRLRRSGCRAKLLGTVISISGAFVVTLYRGPKILLIPSRSMSPSHLAAALSQSKNWVMGSLFLAGDYLIVPMWYIVQVRIMEEYPAEVTVIFFYNLCVSVVAAIVGVIAEPDPSAWRIKLDISLASIVCSGILASFLNSVVHTWALRLKGPVYVAMFKPLSIAIAAAMGVVFLGDILYLGSLLGATIISLGFYTVMWGITTEDMGYPACDITTNLESSSSSPENKSPLLKRDKVQDVEQL